jgi:pimeloyl-ACP methyl ester carboxylesterase
MPEIINHGGQITYDDRGRGEPILLCLPGWCENRTVFRHLIAQCGQKRRVLALDWRSHGESGVSRDFDTQDLVEDVLALIQHSGAERIVPVAISHAGWIALELRRRLGDRVEKIVLLDWIILDPPPPFLEVLQGLQSVDRWEQTRAQLFSMWLADSPNAEVRNHILQEMAAYGGEMWSRAAREISQAYQQAGNPITALSLLQPPVPVLHLYSQPADPNYLAAQRSISETYPWFQVERLEAVTHFPALEVPQLTVEAIERFL